MSLHQVDRQPFGDPPQGFDPAPPSGQLAMGCICDPESYVVEVCGGHSDLWCPENEHNPDNSGVPASLEGQLERWVTVLVPAGERMEWVVAEGRRGRHTASVIAGPFLTAEEAHKALTGRVAAAIERLREGAAA